MKNRLFLFSVFTALSITSCITNKFEKSSEITKKEQNTKFTPEDNKKIVLDFYQQLFGNKNISSIDKFLTPNYIQHNPGISDGTENLKKATRKWFKDAPKTRIDVQQSAAEGDLVFLHIKNTNSDGSLNSTVDIFRLENGKIVEHWDVSQDVPKTSANSHPMF